MSWLYRKNRIGHLADTLIPVADVSLAKAVSPAPAVGAAQLSVSVGVYVGLAVPYAQGLQRRSCLQSRQEQGNLQIKPAGAAQKELLHVCSE